MKKFDWSSFTSNILSVILGIFITFGIQGWIDRSHEKKEVKAALVLVRDELTNNLDNLKDAIDLIESERSAAEFISTNVGRLHRHDADSVNLWNSILGAEYFFTVTGDALELLKASYLFQKINDEKLALDIIKAYDYLETNAQAFNTHEQYKKTTFLDANTSQIKKAALTKDGAAYLNTFYATPEAGYFLKSVIDMSGDLSFLTANIEEIEATVSELNQRVK